MHFVENFLIKHSLDSGNFYSVEYVVNREDKDPTVKIVQAMRQDFYDNRYNYSGMACGCFFLH
jgi:hypothetical protein